MAKTNRLNRGLSETAVKTVRGMSEVTGRAAFVEGVLGSWRRLAKAANNQMSGKRSNVTQKVFKEHYVRPEPEVPFDLPHSSNPFALTTCLFHFNFQT
eukprot:6487446-Amphidinium_carterae.1